MTKHEKKELKQKQELAARDRAQEKAAELRAGWHATWKVIPDAVMPITNKIKSPIAWRLLDHLRTLANRPPHRYSGPKELFAALCECDDSSILRADKVLVALGLVRKSECSGGNGVWVEYTLLHPNPRTDAGVKTSDNSISSTFVDKPADELSEAETPASVQPNPRTNAPHNTTVKELTVKENSKESPRAGGQLDFTTQPAEVSGAAIASPQQRLPWGWEEVERMTRKLFPNAEPLDDGDKRFLKVTALCHNSLDVYRVLRLYQSQQELTQGLRKSGFVHESIWKDLDRRWIKFAWPLDKENFYHGRRTALTDPEGVLEEMGLTAELNKADPPQCERAFAWAIHYFIQKRHAAEGSHWDLDEADEFSICEVVRKLAHDKVKIAALIDAYMADRTDFVKGHPATKLKLEFDHFHATAARNLRTSAADASTLLHPTTDDRDSKSLLQLPDHQAEQNARQDAPAAELLESGSSEEPLPDRSSLGIFARASECREFFCQLFRERHGCPYQTVNAKREETRCVMLLTPRADAWDLQLRDCLEKYFSEVSKENSTIEGFFKFRTELQKRDAAEKRRAIRWGPRQTAARPAGPLQQRPKRPSDCPEPSVLL